MSLQSLKDSIQKCNDIIQHPSHYSKKSILIATKGLSHIMKTVQLLEREDFEKATKELNRLLELQDAIRRYCIDNPTESDLINMFNLDPLDNRNMPLKRKQYYTRKSQKYCHKSKKFNSDTLDELLRYVNDTNLQTRVNAKIYNKFIPREIIFDNKPHAELLANFIIYVQGFALNWSQYLMYHPQGHRILRAALITHDKEAYISLLQILKSVYLTSAFDETLFKSELFKLLPEIKKYLPAEYYGKIAAIVADTATTQLFTKLFGEIPDGLIKRDDRIDKRLTNMKDTYLSMIQTPDSVPYYTPQTSIRTGYETPYKTPYTSHRPSQITRQLFQTPTPKSAPSFDYIVRTSPRLSKKKLFYTPQRHSYKEEIMKSNMKKLQRRLSRRT